MRYLSLITVLSFSILIGCGDEDINPLGDDIDISPPMVLSAPMKVTDEACAEQKLLNPQIGQVTRHYGIVHQIFDTFITIKTPDGKEMPVMTKPYVIREFQMADAVLPVRFYLKRGQKVIVIGTLMHGPCGELDYEDYYITEVTDITEQ